MIFCVREVDQANSAQSQRSRIWQVALLPQVEYSTFTQPRVSRQSRLSIGRSSLQRCSVLHAR